MKKYLLVIILLLLVIAGSFVFLTNKEESQDVSTFAVTTTDSDDELSSVRVGNYSSSMAELVGEYAPKWNQASLEQKNSIAQSILDTLETFVIDGKNQQEHLENAMLISQIQSSLQAADETTANELIQTFFASYSNK